MMATDKNFAFKILGKPLQIQIENIDGLYKLLFVVALFNGIPYHEPLTTYGLATIHALQTDDRQTTSYSRLDL